MGYLFLNRKEAGKSLAEELKARGLPDGDTVILALPRGGVPVAYETARALKLPMDVFIVRKLGAPGHKELAMGAIALGDVAVFNDNIIKMLHISESKIKNIIESEKKELQRRNELYRGGKPPPEVSEKTVILIDDGLATGATMKVAVSALKKMGAKKVVVAVPVGPKSASDDIGDNADEVICLETPEPFYSVGSWYKDFSQTTDQEVQELLSGVRIAAI